MKNKPWPKCKQCGEDLWLSHVRLGFCNIQCEEVYRYEKEIRD